jgi:hypothetical protein
VVALQQVRSNFIRTAVAALTAIKNAPSGGLKQKQLTVELFEYICQKAYIIKECPQFLLVIQRKLVDLHFLDDWPPASSFYLRLFGEQVEAQ